MRIINYALFATALASGSVNARINTQPAAEALSFAAGAGKQQATRVNVLSHGLNLFMVNVISGSSRRSGTQRRQMRMSVATIPYAVVSLLAKPAAAQANIPRPKDLPHDAAWITFDRHGTKKHDAYCPRKPFGRYQNHCRVYNHCHLSGPVPKDISTLKSHIQSQIRGLGHERYVKMRPVSVRKGDQVYNAYFVHRMMFNSKTNFPLQIDNDKVTCDGKPRYIPCCNLELHKNWEMW